MQRPQFDSTTIMMALHSSRNGSCADSRHNFDYFNYGKAGKHSYNRSTKSHKIIDNQIPRQSTLAVLGWHSLKEHQVYWPWR